MARRMAGIVVSGMRGQKDGKEMKNGRFITDWSCNDDPRTEG